MCGSEPRRALAAINSAACSAQIAEYDSNIAEARELLRSERESQAKWVRGGWGRRWDVGCSGGAAGVQRIPHSAKPSPLTAQIVHLLVASALRHCCLHFACPAHAQHAPPTFRTPLFLTPLQTRYRFAEEIREMQVDSPGWVVNVLQGLLNWQVKLLKMTDDK